MATHHAASWRCVWLFCDGCTEMSPMKVTAHAMRQLDKDIDASITSATQISSVGPRVQRTRWLLYRWPAVFLGRPLPFKVNAFLLFSFCTDQEGQPFLRPQGLKSCCKLSERPWRVGVTSMGSHLSTLCSLRMESFVRLGKWFSPGSHFASTGHLRSL